MTPVAEASPASNRDVRQQHRTPTGGADDNERMIIVVAAAMVLIQLWFGLIGTSFWLDETGTWWIVKDGPAAAIHRAFSWSGQSPLYYLTAWISSRFFGLNEIALRIPSVLAMSGALYFLYRIAERLFDRSTAAVVAFVFLCVASFYAIDARPYSLALLCLTVSVWALLRWIDSRGVWDAVVYVIAGALVVYAHCIMSLGLGACFIYGVAATWKNTRRLVWFGLLESITALLCVPLIPQLRLFYATRSSHTFTGLPTSGDLLAGFIPCALAGALILLVWLYQDAVGQAVLEAKCDRITAVLIGSWALFPPLVLFLLPIFADLHLFVDRYYSSALPGQALLAGALLASIRPGAARKALIVTLAAASILAQGRITNASHGNDDWRSALAFAKKEAGPAPVLLVSPFAEAVDFKSVGDPNLRGILFAPELLYGEPASSIRLPHVFAAHDTADLDNLAERLQNEPLFYLINNKPDRSYETWLLGRFGSRCKSETVERTFGLIWLARFTCQTPK